MGFTEYMLKMHKRLSGRKPMGDKRKKVRKRGAAGESRDYKVDSKSPIGKLQSRSRKTKQMLDELD